MVQYQKEIYKLFKFIKVKIIELLGNGIDNPLYNCFQMAHLQGWGSTRVLTNGMKIRDIKKNNPVKLQSSSNCCPPNKQSITEFLKDVIKKKLSGKNKHGRLVSPVKCSEFF